MMPNYVEQPCNGLRHHDKHIRGRAAFEHDFVPLRVPSEKIREMCAVLASHGVEPPYQLNGELNEISPGVYYGFKPGTGTLYNADGTPYKDE